MNTAVDPGITAPGMAHDQQDVVNCGGEAVEIYITDNSVENWPYLGNGER